MSQGDYLKVSGLVFLTVGTLHLVRAFQGWDIMIHTWELPLWASWVIGVIAILLAGHAFWYAKAFKY